MKLSAKLFKIVLPASIILILFIYIFSKMFLLKNFTDIEIQEAHADNKVVINFIQRDLSNLRSMDVDYAKWDDTYNYVINRNDVYITRNFDDTTSLQSAGINFVLITDNRGDIFFDKNVQEKTINIFTETLAEKIASDASKLLSNKNTKNVLGIDEYNKIPILISAERITKNDGSGVSPGIFIFAKYYNKKQIAGINQKTQLKTELVSYDKNLILNNDSTNNDSLLK